MRHEDRRIETELGNDGSDGGVRDRERERERTGERENRRRRDREIAASDYCSRK